MTRRIKEMGKKNKHKKTSREVMSDVEKTMEENVKKTNTPAEEKNTVPIDEAPKKLLELTAARNKVSKQVLVELAIQALMGSVESYGYRCMNVLEAQGSNAAKGKAEHEVSVSKNSHDAIKAVALYFGVPMADVLRDAIVAQRFNWQRMQPVNARAMSSMRLQMFQLEQLGPRN